MRSVQITVADTQYAAALGDALKRGGDWQVNAVETPDVNAEGVLVLDRAALSRLSVPLPHPERVVLIASNDPEELSRAWQAGIISVIFDSDSLNTAILAIMSAAFRVSRTGGSGGQASDSGEGHDDCVGHGSSRNRCCRSHSNVIYEAENEDRFERGPQRGGGAA